VDPAEYRRASRAIWEKAAQGWEERHAFIERTTRPVTERMLAAIPGGSGLTILELAAGTGVVGLTAAAALGDRGRVILSDFSQAMLDAAARQGGRIGLDNVEYRILDAERLDLPDRSVDCVLCRFGYMLMADPGAALAETRRVLRPGGGLACAVVGPAEANPWSSLPGRLLVEAGHMQRPAPGTPGIHALADPERLRAVIAGAGFDEPRVEEVHMQWTFSDEPDYWAFLQRMAGPIAAIFEGLEAGERARLRRELAQRLEPYAGGDGIALPLVALVATAAAPA
jgi:ubiquinone/menaquinone biosynthesis C-methylase UbiE